MKHGRNEDGSTRYLYGICCAVTVIVVLLPLFSRINSLPHKPVMAMLQIATLFTAKIFFERIAQEEQEKIGALAGIVLYLTFPYRIDMCYGEKGIMAAAVWMLLPLYGWALAETLRRRKIGLQSILVASGALAGIGYADFRFLLLTLVVTVLTAFWQRTVLPCLAATGGCVLFAPGWYRLGKYLLTDDFAELNLSVQSIMPDGYTFGQFFSSYRFREGLPGMGLGLILCMVLGMWSWFVKRDKPGQPEKFFIGCALLFLFCATRYCPWDLVQRLGTPFLRLIGMFQTPTFFFGYACACLCVAAVYVVRRLRQQDSRIASAGMPALIVAFGMGICLYQGYRLGI